MSESIPVSGGKLTVDVNHHLKISLFSIFSDQRLTSLWFVSHFAGAVHSRKRIHTTINVCCPSSVSFMLKEPKFLG